MKRLAWVLALGVLAVACDDGPSGPGELNGVVQGSGAPLGGAVLEVTGKAITGFSGGGSTRVIWAGMSTPDRYRVVLVSQAPGKLQFQVEVSDLGARRPDATLLSLVGGDNLPIPGIDSYRVSFSR